MLEPLISLVVVGLGIALGWALLWPGSGLLARWERTRRLGRRALREDAVKHLHKYELENRHPTVESIAGALQISLDEAASLASELQDRKLVGITEDEFHLTPQGRDYALHVIRAHRLWERYLADETGVDSHRWHEIAELNEHRLTREEVEALSAQLGNPTHDPHGDPIPSPSGQLYHHGGSPLSEMGMDRPFRIVHVEDEPPAIYSQLLAEGLHPGMTGRIVEKTDQRIRFWADGEEHILAPLLARNLSVTPEHEELEVATTPYTRLSELSPGEVGRVVRIAPASRGAERRRFMDLGILPGTEISAELRSAGGDPTAYRIRGALIALRKTQADAIYITLEKKAS